MKLARVFPTKTSMLPVDTDAYFGPPDLFTPHYDEVHISVVFTWDIPKAKQLAEIWTTYGKVKIGGPGIDGESKEPFTAGMYLRGGITITSRGCPKKCSFCMVGKELIEFDNFPEGNIVQDNNILACSKKHWDLVVTMLRQQKGVVFSGGLDKYLLTDKHIEDLRGLRIKTLWLACDSPKEIGALTEAVERLKKAGFSRGKIFCYVLIGKDMTEEEQRMRMIFDAGAIPFAQLYRDKDNSIEYSKEWRQFARCWSRPAAIKSICKKTT